MLQNRHLLVFFHRHKCIASFAFTCWQLLRLPSPRNPHSSTLAPSLDQYTTNRETLFCRNNIAFSFPFFIQIYIIYMYAGLHSQSVYSSTRIQIDIILTSSATICLSACSSFAIFVASWLFMFPMMSQAFSSGVCY